MAVSHSRRTSIVAFLVLILSIAVAAEEQFKSFHKTPAGAKVYVAPISGGFDTYIIAGFQQKKVPLVIVTDRARAEYEITGFSETDKAGWAKMLFLGSQHSNEQASIKMVNLQTVRSYSHIP